MRVWVVFPQWFSKLCVEPGFGSHMLIQDLGLLTLVLLRDGKWLNLTRSMQVGWRQKLCDERITKRPQKRLGNNSREEGGERRQGRGGPKGRGEPVESNAKIEDLKGLVAQTAKHLSTMQETWVRSLGQEVSLEKETTTSSHVWVTTPVLLPRKSHGQRSLVQATLSMGSQRVRHDWAASLHFKGPGTLPTVPSLGILVD